MPIYDNFARYYDAVFAPLERIGLARFRRETIAELPDNARILELGSGTGANFKFYPKSTMAVSTELSLEMLRAAKQKTTSNFLVNADAQYLPFGENEFDAAFATLVFCSIPEPRLAFAELKRVVRPGGTVVLLEHVRPNGVLGRVFDGLNRFTSSVFEDHFNRRTAVTAAESGLEIVEVRTKLFGIVNLIVCRVQHVQEPALK
jgi:ubiquinone/menaquinone biosynthesis C-methylase UbiE